MSGNKPEASFRLGSVVATVWLNEGRSDRQFRSVVLQRKYRDDEGDKYSNSFSLGDLANAIRVLQLVQEHIERHELGSASEEE